MTVRDGWAQLAGGWVGRRLLGAVRLFLPFAAGGLAALAGGAVVGLDASDFADGRGVRAERRGAI